MLRPRDIEEAGFAKAIFGGYDMESVDDFLEIVADDYSKIYKDNAVLKSKMKVLVNKIEEYRSSEEASKMELMKARKAGEELLNQAKLHGNTILAEAEAEAKARLQAVEKLIEEEEERLRKAQQETYEFIKASQKLVDVYRSFLSKIEGIELVPEPEPEPEPVKAPPKIKMGEQPATTVTLPRAMIPTNRTKPVPPPEEKKPIEEEIKPNLEDTMIFSAPASLSTDNTEETINNFVSSILSQNDEDDMHDIKDIRQEYATRRVRHSSKRPTTDQVTLFASDKMSAEVSAFQEKEALKDIETKTDPVTRDSKDVFDEIAEAVEEAIPTEEPVQTEEKDEAALYEETKRLFFEDDDSRSPRPKFDFENLQFGSNYDSSK